MDIDHKYDVYLWTPEGLSVGVVVENLPSVVRNHLADTSFVEASKTLSKLTGLRCTVVCTSKYTTKEGKSNG